MVATSGDAPAAANDDEDELFGDLTADDHADQHERGVNPQQAAGAPRAVAIGAPDAGGGEEGGGGGGDGGGLAGHETRANEAAFRKMGYLEAYDATKEERLQEGFEAGYREAVDVAMSIGLKLGRLMGRTAAGAATAATASTGSQGKHNGDTEDDGGDNCDDDNDERVEKEAAAAAARLAAKTIRTFLDGQLTQPSDAVSPDEALQQVRDLEKEVNEQFCDGQEEATCTTLT